ncbi:MAG TPA: family 16 glycosylhydrolase, partial [Candidatus Izemoplasmatales bacterium]|nr:family 16 glycosylhydrolase [Candidatus Izemoplasmatales bacterium]
QYFYSVQKNNIADEFHRFGFEWTENKITYYIDGKKKHTYVKGGDNKDITHQGWPFDQSFYLIMNLAIGGTLGGEIDVQSFPQKFVIQSIHIESY